MFLLGEDEERELPQKHESVGSHVQRDPVSMRKMNCLWGVPTFIVS
jgi:hypothetical protein